MTKRIWIGGPLTNPKRWAQAAEAAGWEAYERPHIGVAQLDVDLTEGLDGLPDWLCITSSSALPAIERAFDSVPELRTVPAAVVGDATVERAAAVGAKVQLSVSEGGRRLADELIAGTGSVAQSALWPRGDYSDDLAGFLSEAGWTVRAPHVYRTEFLALEGEHPTCDAVFFASPSGVTSFCTSQAFLRCGHPSTAIAMGSKTLGALAEAYQEASPYLDFPERLMVDAPRPNELTKLLERLNETVSSPDTSPESGSEETGSSGPEPVENA